MESLEIAVSTREATGKGGARKLRRDGRVPGILYSKQENLALTVDLGEFNKLLRRASAGNALLDVNVEGGKQVKALIKEIQRDPIFGPIFSAAGVVFVDRADTGKAIEALQPAVEALRQGRSLAIAPEGTRSPTPKLGRFKKGAFHMAMQAGVPIVPVVFRNVLDAFPKDASVIRPATIEVVVLPPVETRDWTVEGLDEEIRRIRDRYLAVLRQDVA